MQRFIPSLLIFTVAFCLSSNYVHGVRADRHQPLKSHQPGGIVHQIKARHVPVPLAKTLNRKFPDGHPLMVEASSVKLPPMLEQLQKIRASLSTSGISITKTASHCIKYLVGSVGVGTPDQKLDVNFDLWSNDFFVAAPEAYGGSGQHSSQDGDESHRGFDKSKSSTFNSSNKYFVSEWLQGFGKYGSDIVKFGSVEANMTFGVASHLSFLMEDAPVEGVFGLSPTAGYKKNSVPTALQQLAKYLQRPVYTIWNDSPSECGQDGSAVLTFGAEDTENCEGDFVYTTADSKAPTLAFHLGSVSINDERLNVSASVVLVDYDLPLVTSVSLGKAIIKATGAKWSWETWKYEVACDAEFPSIKLNLGANGEGVTLLKDDLIVEEIKDGESHCHVNVYPFFPDHSAHTLFLGQRFFSNHCIAYNIQENLIGFAEAKKAEKSGTETTTTSTTSTTTQGNESEETDEPPASIE